MIPKEEIMALATELQLQVHIVEKDYALGWLLAGIAAHPAICDRWVFKGGTSLKKCCILTSAFSTGSGHQCHEYGPLKRDK